MTNSSWFAGDFPILALASLCSQNSSVPGKPNRLVGLERGFISTDLLNQEFDSVHCSFFFFQKWKTFKVHFLILALFYKLLLVTYHLLIGSPSFMQRLETFSEQ